MNEGRTLTIPMVWFKEKGGGRDWPAEDAQ